MKQAQGVGELTQFVYKKGASKVDKIVLKDNMTQILRA